MVRILNKLRKWARNRKLLTFVMHNYINKKMANREKTKKIIEEIADKTGKSVGVIKRDMFHKCYKTQALFSDYYRFGFYEKTMEEADRYLTNDRYSRVMERLFTPEIRRIMNNKPLFNEVFREFIKRDYLPVDVNTRPEDIEEFVRKHPVFIGKRRNLNMGRGIKLVDTAAYPDLRSLLEYLRSNNIGIIEERVENHPDLKKYSKVSLNTLRIISVKLPEGVKIIAALLKFGDGYNLADSPGAGYKCPVDPETGVIYGGVTGSGKLDMVFLKRHPLGYEMVGVKIPFWEELVKLVKDAMMHLEDAFYIPWDVAVTPDGALIIEGNVDCGYNYQWATGRPVYHDMKRASEFAVKSRRNRLAQH